VTRARPKPRHRPAAARRSKLRPCTYTPDGALPDPADPPHPLCVCSLPRRHPRHNLPAAPAQAEHRRRAGDRED
jgi:hypothetical protein